MAWINIKKHIPNTLTLLNIIAGSLSIVLAFSGDLFLSSILMLIAFHADIFDGMMARILKVQSELGKQLDSLADIVSFGVAPAVLLHVKLMQELNLEYYTFSADFQDWFIPLIPFLIPAFSALRLAKFNIDENQSDQFIGLPTPANALMVLTMGLLTDRQPNSFILDLIWNPTGIIAYSLIISFLLIAPITLYGLKLKGFSWSKNKYRYIFLLSCLGLVIAFRHTGLFLTITWYFIYGVVLGQLKKRGLIN